MNLEQQVASLDLCKRLKALGVKQESAFYWRIRGGELLTDARLSDKAFLDENKAEVQGWFIYSAFTVAELGEILPDFYQCSWKPSKNEWVCGKMEEGFVDLVSFRFNCSEIGICHTEADARAKMLIYLIEQGIINLKGGGE